MKKLLFFISAILFVSLLHAQTYNSDDTGFWVNDATWTTTAPPTTLSSSENITINNPHVVTRDGDLTVKSNNVTITVNSGARLFVDGGILGESNPNNLTLTVNGDLEVADSIEMNNNTTITVNDQITVGGGIKLHNNSSIDINGTGVINGDIDVHQNNTVNIDVNSVLTLYGNLNGHNDNNNFLTGPATATLNVVAINNFDTTGFGGTINYIVLPVELASFTGVAKKDGAMLKWKTLSEDNNAYFTLYRSYDMTNWKTVATIQGAGSTSLESSYSYFDRTIRKGVVYYRLQQTDYDGQTVMFPPISVESKNDFDNVFIFPMPVSSMLHVKGDGIVSVDLYSLAMELLITESVDGNVGHIDVKDLPSGTYVLKINSLDSSIVKQIVVR